MRLVDIYLNDNFTTCEACGHDIKWRYVIQTGERRMTVGSECANTLLGPDMANMDRRAKRAAAQWRKQEPAPLEGEAREQYIARRMVEMTNARRAYNAYIRIGDIFAYTRKVNRRAVKMFRIEIDTWSRLNYTPFKADVIRSRVVRRIARRYNANQYDFDGRRPWEVVKI